MIDAGENRLVRLGGRSKSDKVEGFCLKNLSRKNESRDDFCNRRMRQVTAELFGLKERIEEAVEKVNAPIAWKSVREFLRYDDPETLGFLQLPDLSDGYQIIGPSRKAIGEAYLWKCWQAGDHLPAWVLPYLEIEKFDEFDRFWVLPLEDRLAMIRQWKRDIVQPSGDVITTCVNELNSLVEQKQSLRQAGDLEILKHARVIGATTSGATNYRDLLAMAAIDVVMVEEAGEVLEAHILTSLSGATPDSEACQHLIMIGDHKQLPPKVEQYNLTTTSGGGYNLDCSLFERLILARLPSVTLAVQHRMRPSISALIRAQTYPRLIDHESVRSYPDLKGVAKNVVFLDHRQPEDGADSHESKTKMNSVEAELSLEIVRYFLLQGYAPDKIVVLTPYLGQLVKLVNLMRTNLKEVTALVSERDVADLDTVDEANSIGFGSIDQQRSVRCSSIDNFQGEEADIVVISLVRSNSRGNIGFLKEKQRVNVLLSRARLGMVLVGDSSTLTGTTAGRLVWGSILQTLSADGCLLKGLPTICQLHPDDEVLNLCDPAEFRARRPNGGCHRPCTFRLQCGHVCPLMCHPTDRSHERAALTCGEPCRRFPPGCPLQHPCSKLCNEVCGRCCAIVDPIRLECGHVMDHVKCYETGSTEALERLTLRCRSTVAHKFLTCEHVGTITCGNSRLAVPLCPAICRKPAGCEHPCAKV